MLLRPLVVTAIRPPGLRTRCSSAMACSWSGRGRGMCMAMTVSNVPSSKGSDWASAVLPATVQARSVPARLIASLTIRETSARVSSIRSGRRSATDAQNQAGPQPTSRTRARRDGDAPGEPLRTSLPRRRWCGAAAPRREPVAVGVLPVADLFDVADLRLVHHRFLKRFSCGLRGRALHACGSASRARPS